MSVFWFLVALGLGIAVYFLYNKLKSAESKSAEYKKDANAANEQVVLYRNKYSPIINIDEAVIERQQQKIKIEADIKAIQESYKTKKFTYDSLVKKIAIYDEEIELAEMGFYKPHFDFDVSEIYKNELKKIRERQKTMLKDKVAITCSTEWTVGNSKSEGKKMTNRGIRLTARAFNNECEAAIANVRWNNVVKMEERIQKAHDDINKLNESNHIQISYKYLQLKLDELHLAYEYQDKLKQEKEEQAEIRRQMKEELKLEQEVQAAQKEEEKFQKLLAKAHADAAKSVGEDMSKLNAEIEALSAKLAEAHAKAERAKSMAQQTKVGHVYIISNVGSFGEDVYKIGMTRRLEPVDRVNELGDASVPFYFDIHAMIYSENAPAMENALHKAFAEKRLNLVNYRKEFFHVSLDDIQAEVTKICPDAEFVLTAEASQYRQSQMIRHEKAQAQIRLEQELPATI